jgi:hypothetical protein
MVSTLFYIGLQETRYAVAMSSEEEIMVIRRVKQEGQFLYLLISLAS